MQNSLKTDAIVLFAHGSSDARWAEPFVQVRDLLARQQATPVRLAFLERTSPSLDETIADLARGGHKCIALVPMFLGVGGHLRKDMPILVSESEAKHCVAIHVQRSIGESPEMIDALAQWITAEIKST